MTETLATGFGLMLLLLGGATLVRGASLVAGRFGVSEMLVGLTVVAFGTSMPELVVNVFSSLRGNTELAFGNVIGSNITNFGLVLGVAAAITPIRIEGQIIRRELPLLLLATSIITVMALDRILGGTSPIISRSDSIVLLLLFLIFLYLVIGDIVAADPDEPLLGNLHQARLRSPPRNDQHRWLLVITGIALLYLGGELTVSNATALAERLGVPTAIVGLFLVAVGTSLPELVTSVIAALRKAPDIALGNVVGSNIFNSLIVLPSAGIISPILMPRGGIGDLLISLMFAMVLIPVFHFGNARLGRPAAAAFLFVYFGYALLRTYHA